MISNNLFSLVFAVKGKLKNKISHGEQAVAVALNQLHIDYKTEKLINLNKYNKTINWCRLDFYIPGNIPTIIEYNGRQHYEYVPDLQKSESDFIRQQERDATLRNYCNLNNIKLIEIKYTVPYKDIKNKLQEALAQSKSIHLM